MFSDGKFTYANVFPMREAYKSGLKQCVTYCYIDSEWQKHEKKLTQKYILNMITSERKYVVAYTENDSILLLYYQYK